jgi:hypothetical protein
MIRGEIHRHGKLLATNKNGSARSACADGKQFREERAAFARGFDPFRFPARISLRDEVLINLLTTPESVHPKEEEDDKVARGAAGPSRLRGREHVARRAGEATTAA